MQCGDKKKYFFSFFNGNFSNTWKLFWELIYFAGKKCSDRKKATIMTEPFQDLLYPLAPVVRWERQGVVKNQMRCHSNALFLSPPPVPTQKIAVIPRIASREGGRAEHAYGDPVLREIERGESKSGKPRQKFGCTYELKVRGNGIS